MEGELKMGESESLKQVSGSNMSDTHNCIAAYDTRQSATSTRKWFKRKARERTAK